MAAKLLKLRRGTTTQHSTFTGAEGEVTVDTDKDVLVVNDGLTAGGHPLAAEDMSNVSSASIAGRLGNDSIATSKIAAGALPTDVTVASANIVDGTIVNADVNASAAIAGTKISPDFGSQNIATTGNASIGGTNLNMSSAYIDFSGSISTPSTAAAIYRPADNSLAVSTANNERLLINNNGAQVTGNLDVSSGVDVTGNITVTGTVDGRDVAADGSKLDGIDSGAKDDQTAAEIKTLLASDQLTSSHLATDSVTSGKIVNLNVTRAKIANDAINGDKLADDSIDSEHYVDGSIDDVHLANNSVATSKIPNNAVTLSKIVQVNQNRIIGRIASGSGDVTTLTPANVRSMINVADGATSYTSNQATNTSSNVTFGTINCSSLTATGNVTAFSDATLKTDIHSINDALGIVGKLRGVTYKWLSNGEADIGVIAQEVQEVVPEVIKETEDGIKTVDYGRLVSVLINAVKELNDKLDKHMEGGK
tara:strand:- start:610 stop:2046 length:1437 start_codon:yes stop_codon:yes gene_type:complete